MATKESSPVHHAQRALDLTRIFDAPRDLVFRAWTDPKQVAQWWGPHGFTNPVCEMDVRSGGAILIHMRGPDGTLYPMKGTFQEIVKPERLVMTTTAFENADGSFQLEVLNTITFVEVDGKTKVTVHAVVVKSTPAVAGALEGMEEGWKQQFDKLAAHLR